VSPNKRRRRRPQPAPVARAAEPPEELEPKRTGPERAPRRSGPLGGALFAGGPSALPPIGRSIGRGLLAVASQPVLVALTFLLVLGTWLALLAIGFEGLPNRLVDVLALAPISTYFDIGSGTSLYGVGPSFLVFIGVSLVIRALVTAILSGMILEALEHGEVTRYGVLRGLVAIPTALVVQVASFSLIIAGNLVFPVLGPGLGFLGFVSALVGGLFFLGFAPTAAIREGRPVMETVRRSARAAMLPGGRHLLLCSLYFFIALPVAVGFAPGGTEISANPTLVAWVFILLANVLHVAFMAAFAYRWVVAEPEVPDEPVRRRASAGRTAAMARRR
jgi:hypothetical protein